MRVLLLFTVIAATSARAKPGTCEVSDWSEWTRHDSTIASFKVDEKDLVRGQALRDLMMNLMNDQYEVFRQCMTEETCPEFANNRIDGFAACTLGTASTPTADYPCNGVDHLAFVPSDELFPDPTVVGTRETNDIWGWVDPLNDDEYALVAMNDGTSFVRITPGADPTDVNPVVLGHLRTAAGDNVGTWRDIKVYNDYAFIVSEHEGHGMQVFDLTRLRGLDGSAPQRFDADGYYGGTGNSHNIVSSPRGYMYLVGSTSTDYPNNCQGGLHVVDVNDPTNPTFAGCFGDDGYTHDAQCIVYDGPDVTYQGREICMCYNEDTFTIVDVEDKGNMLQISRTGYAGSNYTHQGWITDDHTVVLVHDEMDAGDQRTYIWDVIDLENPILQNTYISGLQSLDHNQYIVGDMAYQANYRTGLRVLRLDQAGFSLNELAFFDNYPQADGAEFNGAWSNYPYLPSGNVIITSSEYGFYVLRPNVTPGVLSEKEKRTSSMQRRRYREILHVDEGAACPPLTEIEA